MSRRDPRALWREIYRLARLTPCSDRANLTWADTYPLRIRLTAISAAWTGHHADSLEVPMWMRRAYHRNGVSTSYIVNKCANPSLPK